MSKCIVTAFDKDSWQQYGASFLGSTWTFNADFTGGLAVIEYGLPYKALFRLKQNGVHIVNGRGNYFVDVGRAARNELADYDKLAYWGADVYFQGDLEDAFTNHLSYCLDKSNYGQATQPNDGYLAASATLWGHFADFLTFAIKRGSTTQEGLNTFVKCFAGLTKEAPETWNYTAVGNLKWDGGFKTNGKLVKVVHPCGALRNLVDGKFYSFKEKYPELYDQFHNMMIMGNTTSARGLLKKSSKHLLLSK